MNKFYLIVPLILTVAFGGIYVSHRKEAAIRAEEERVVLARAEADELARKAAAERQASDDADRRAAERIAEEKRKEDDKRAKWEATGRELAAETANYRAQAEKSATEAAELKTRLSALRAEREQASRAEFQQASEIERERVRKRNAELEIQRLVEAVARKGAGSSLGAVGAIP